MQEIPLGLSFDDVQVIPRYSSLSSRDLVSTEIRLGSVDLKIPFISANMDTVTDVSMCRAMHKAGGLGILHRYMSLEDVRAKSQDLNSEHINFGVSLGVEDVEQWFQALQQIPIVCIDVAHGDHVRVVEALQKIRKIHPCHEGIIAGNVCTVGGARRLAEAGANIIKVGVGPGSMCTTRLQTGCGYPQLSAIMNISTALEKEWPCVQVIGDGGIKYSGDIVKALVGGADVIMSGFLLSGTDETPGDLRHSKKFGLSKVYRGMAGRSAQTDAGKKAKYIEGVETEVPYRGSVLSVLDETMAGVRSGMSYVGASTIDELSIKGEFIRVTPAGQVEATPHGVDYVHKIQGLQKKSFLRKLFFK